MDSPAEGAGQSVWQRIDEICDRFEAAKRKGKGPRITDFLAEAKSGDERDLLLRELIQVELEIASAEGSIPDIQQYLEQLPEDEELIRSSFGRHRSRGNSDASTLPLEPQLQPGQEFGAYTIVNRIGEGGMGHVYQARHKTMDRVVALKVLAPRLLNSPDAVARFHREIKAAARLQHPNIVTAHDAGEQDGLHFLVMEYVDGRDLSAYVKKKGPLNLKQAIKCTIQAAKGLAYAHEQNIVHRDIKPSNLLVDRKGTVKVLDMGLARFEMESEDHELTNLTGTGVVMGTIDYMAPEQSLDTRTADARSDIYSLGCTLWYLLTGKVVYGGDTVMKKLLAHREEEIPRLRTLSEKFPESVDIVFRKMIAKDKSDRHQSMEEVIEDLQNCLKIQSSPDSNSEISMVADPRLASFFQGDEASNAKTAKMDYEESRSHTHLHAATLIGDGKPVPPTRTQRRATGTIGKLPKWVFGVGGALILVALITLSGGRDPETPASGIVKSAAESSKVPDKSTALQNKEKELSSLPAGAQDRLADETATPLKDIVNQEYKSIPAGAFTIVRRLNGHARHIYQGGLDWSPDGQYIISGGVGKAQMFLWEAKSGKKVRNYDAPANTSEVLFLNHADDIVSGTTSWTGPPKTPIIVWNRDSGKEIRRFGKTSETIDTLGVSADGKIAISGSNDGWLRFYDFPTGEELHSIKYDKNIFVIEISSDNNSVLASTSKGLGLFDLTNYEMIKLFPFPSNGKFFRAARFSDNNQLFLSGTNSGLVQLWDKATGNEICRFTGHSESIESVAFLPDGEHILSSSDDRTMRIWNIATQQEVARLETTLHATSVFAVSPDGKYVASAGGWHYHDGRHKLDPEVPIYIWQLSRSAWSTRRSDKTDPWQVEREVAEWAISKGGMVELRTRSGVMVSNVNALNDLPVEDFYVSRVRVYPPAAWDDSTVQKLEQLSSLRELTVNGAEITEASLQTFKRAKNLYLLSLTGTGITTTNLNQPNSLDQVRILLLDDRQIDDNWNFLKSMPNLHNLTILSPRRETLLKLAQSDALKQSQLKYLGLSLQKTDLTSEVTQIQSQNPRLRILEAKTDGMTISGQDPLPPVVRELKKKGFHFKGLYLNGGDWNSTHSDQISGKGAYKIYNVEFPRGYRLANSDLPLLQTLEYSGYVVAVNLQNTRLLVDVIKDSSAGTVVLTGSDLTDEDFEQLSAIVPLYIIDIRKTAVTQSAIERVKRKRPDLIIKSDYGTFGIEPPLSPK